MSAQEATELTGNDYVSLPRIGGGCAISEVTILHAGLSGMVEWTGGPEPLLRLRIIAGGREVPLEDARWRRLDRWIPSFTLQAEDILVSGTVCAPTGYPAARGFFVRLEVEQGGRAAMDVEVRLELSWESSRLWVGSGRPLAGRNRLVEHSPGTLILETDDGRGPTLAIAAAGSAALEGIAGQADGSNGTALRASLVQSASLVPKRRTPFTFWFGVGRERDGAVAATDALNRRGADELLRQARLELSHTLRAAQDHRWSDMLNRNLLFCRYFATGRAVDDDQLWLVRSRSPRCPQPALFNEREALFWTLPALVAADPGIAREALLRSLDVYSERSGERLRYLGGGAFDSGFVLEQFLLYAWAIDFYSAATNDSTILDEPVVQQVIMENDAALYMRLHPEHLLCSTDLLPSGDSADHPFTTMGNALVAAFARSLPRLWPKFNGSAEPPPRFEGTADETVAAIWQHLTAPIRGEQVLACAGDLAGQVAVYDDPAMSLALLPWFGFCDADDPVWIATMEFLRSPAYPLYSAGAVPGVAHRTGPGRPALAALVADLLGPAPADALDRLLRLRLPGGLAAASWDPETGEGQEPYHAALAGFLAWALIRAAEPKAPPRGRRPRR